MVNHHEKGSLRPEIMFRGLEYLIKNHFSYRNIIIENYDEWINHHNETDSPYEDQRYTFILVWSQSKDFWHFSLLRRTCKCLITQKNCQIIYMVNIIIQQRKFEKKYVRPYKKIEVKGGPLVKKWELGQTKDNFMYWFFKRIVFAFNIPVITLHIRKKDQQ